jgi:hypothetical protein
MSSRKSYGNGFSNSVRRIIQSGGPPELVKLCNPLWCNLTVEGRFRYSRESREALSGENECFYTNMFCLTAERGLNLFA